MIMIEPTNHIRTHPSLLELGANSSHQPHRLKTRMHADGNHAAGEDIVAESVCFGTFTSHNVRGAFCFLEEQLGLQGVEIRTCLRDAGVGDGEEDEDVRVENW